MRENTSVATPRSTGMVSSSRRTRYLCIEVKALHQLRKTLAAQSKRRGCLAAMPRRPSERRADESLFELESRVLQRFVRHRAQLARSRPAPMR